MGDLRDAFKKAGLLDDKAARRLRHEERVQRKELGRDGQEEQRRREEAERRQREEQKRVETKAAQQRHDAERQREERRKQLERQVDEQAIRGGSGPRRFHYSTTDGYLPYLQVDDETGRKLEAGEIALVESPSNGELTLLPRALALELAAVMPERLLHLAGGSR